MAVWSEADANAAERQDSGGSADHQSPYSVESSPMKNKNEEPQSPYSVESSPIDREEGSGNGAVAQPGRAANLEGSHNAPPPPQFFAEANFEGVHNAPPPQRPHPHFAEVVNFDLGYRRHRSRIASTGVIGSTLVLSSNTGGVPVRTLLEDKMSEPTPVNHEIVQMAKQVQFEQVHEIDTAHDAGECAPTAAKGSKSSSSNPSKPRHTGIDHRVLLQKGVFKMNKDKFGNYRDFAYDQEERHAIIQEQVEIAHHHQQRQEQQEEQQHTVGAVPLLAVEEPQS